MVTEYYKFESLHYLIKHTDESQKMVEAVNRFGGNARLTVYPENDHDSWSATYSNSEVFEWLLSNQNNNDLKLLDNFDNKEIYG